MLFRLNNYQITWFLEQFGVNEHLSIFSRTTILLSLKMSLQHITSNCTWNHVITYKYLKYLFHLLLSWLFSGPKIYCWTHQLWRSCYRWLGSSVYNEHLKWFLLTWRAQQWAQVLRIWNLSPASSNIWSRGIFSGVAKFDFCHIQLLKSFQTDRTEWPNSEWEHPFDKWKTFHLILMVTKWWCSIGSGWKQL